MRSLNCEVSVYKDKIYVGQTIIGLNYTAPDIAYFRSLRKKDKRTLKEKLSSAMSIEEIIKSRKEIKYKEVLN